jgi:hypothetical protein
MTMAPRYYDFTTPASSLRSLQEQRDLLERLDPNAREVLRSLSPDLALESTWRLTELIVLLLSVISQAMEERRAARVQLRPEDWDRLQAEVGVQAADQLRPVLSLDPGCVVLEVRPWLTPSA